MGCRARPCSCAPLPDIAGQERTIEIEPLVMRADGAQRGNQAPARSDAIWNRSRAFMARLAVLLAVLGMTAMWARAQVTDNDVIQVAERMYCPVCENIPLDECQTTACQDWKEEIRAQLAAGRGAQEVIDSFVARFGDHVVGLPQDPLLRALTFIAPLLATATALGLGVITFRRFNRRPALSPNAERAAGEQPDEVYRQRIEEDLRARR